MPLFSVTIPAFKGKYLKECIDSILAQSFSDFELIIVNDASPEDLDSIVIAYSDQRIRYYVNDINCGAVNVVDNWNKCLGYTRGKYIICMGDDDKLLPNCLAEYVKLIDKYPNLGVYHAWTEIIDENSQFVKFQTPRPEYEGCMSMTYNRWNGRSQYIGDFCFDADKLRSDGGFFKLPLAWASDDITATRASSHGGIANTQVPCFQYRISRYTISNSGNLPIKVEASLLEKEWYQKFLEQELNKLTDHTTTEYKYCQLLLADLDRFMLSKLKPGVTDDLIVKPSRFIWWCKNCKKYGLTRKMIFVSTFLAIANKLHLTHKKI